MARRLVTLPARQAVTVTDRTMNEAQLARIMLDVAHAYGWQGVHFRPGMNERGQWRTAYEGDGQGWPDWFLWKGDQAIAVELERQGVKCPADQVGKLQQLRQLRHVQSFVWRPGDRDLMATVLSGQLVDPQDLR